MSERTSERGIWLITDTHLPQTEEANVAGVHLCYDDLIEAAETGAKGLEPDRRAELHAVAASLSTLVDELQPEK